MSSGPEISVSVMVDGQRERGARCLQSILSQSIIDEMEVLVFDFAPPEVPPLRGSEHPSVRVVRVDRALTFGGARAFSVRMARAPIVAFLEEHVVVSPGWAEALLKAHRAGWTGVGPEMHNLVPGRVISDAMFLAGYAQWTPPLAPGESDLIPSQNSSFKRDALLRYDSDLDRLLEADIMLQWRLRDDGYKLYQTPDAKVIHAGETKVRTVVIGSFLIMRYFAPLRAELYHWSPLRRALRVLLTSFAPFYRTARLYVGLVRRRSSYLWTALAGAWVVFVANAGGAAGEAVGLIEGAPVQDPHLLLHVMNAARDGAVTT